MELTVSREDSRLYAAALAHQNGELWIGLLQRYVVFLDELSAKKNKYSNASVSNRVLLHAAKTRELLT